ncbi:hypothetical protein DFP72DRAFT_867164 [Ephemerocybe angulata]|uniref:Uncharacterized protein n=1 Tax=Ephemerocybe angulata TaxID=980116 RepID=A0A8H6IKB3_9AGAR|nr:hypothetical protein DFP72DRAFT_867164 [Tulosesus angulatus]
MERSGFSAEEDVFTARREPSSSTLASSPVIRPQIPSPSPFEAPPTRQSRQFPEYSQKPYGLGFTPPIRRGSPLNPQKASQRRSLQSNVSVMDSPPPRHRRIPSPGIMDIGGQPIEQEPETSSFSNEYDLSHEDPRILLDVQRALKLKARREARLKREQSASPHQPSPSSTQYTAHQTPPELSQASWRTRQSTLPSPPPSPTPPRKASGSATSDLDFSPATGVPAVETQPHPVPASLDNGKTLDWTGSIIDDEKAEKRWPLMGKRKDKDKMLPLNALAEQQEHLYRGKLENIKMQCSSQTLRKASITREQLGRRYKLLSEHLAPPNETPKFHFLAVAHWWSTVNPMVKQAMEKAEPFSWLKHLEKGHKERSPWHLSALTMEEYLQARSTIAAMPTIHEDASLHESPSSSYPNSNLPSPDVVSFEPRRDSAEIFDARRGKASIDSSTSLPPSGLPLSKSPFRNSASPRLYHQPYPRGDGLSAPGSGSDLSEHDLTKNLPPVRSRSEHPSPQIQVIVTQDSEDKVEQSSVTPLQIKLSTSTSTKASDLEHPSANERLAPPLPSRSTSRAKLPRRIRVSQPTAEVPRRHTGYDDTLINRKYEARARLVEEANVHNQRIRQTLNRISAAVREYDAIQASALKTPGIPHLPLPKELVEAFSHDPAAVTGATRRLTGWRAVEDIHQRINRQREIFQSFLSQPPSEPSDSIHILDSPISQLVESLNVLETEKDEIMTTATNLAELLQKVQAVHRDVKSEYNQTVSATSVVYPELSHIIALEESYRDQYQQLWDFGMDALTLLLDTVTPFWRNYGKTIGEDVRDFLIIPLYRNEFTGEAKRYPLREIPRRSLRHWLGFILFFLLSIGITFLQIRAAITSSVSYRLQWIPYDSVRWTALPFFWVGILIQWIAVLFELSVVVMQLGIITWWTGWLINVFQ